MHNNEMKCVILPWILDKTETNKQKTKNDRLVYWEHLNVNFILDNGIVSMLNFLSMIIVGEGRRMSLLFEDARSSI